MPLRSTPIISLMSGGSSRLGPRQTVSGPFGRLPWTLVSLGVTLVVVHLASPEGRIADGAYAAALWVGVALAWVGASRRQPADRARWMWVAIAVTSTAVGDSIYTVNGWLSDTWPDISIADGFWMGSYVALGVALLKFAQGRQGDPRPVDALIDSAVAGVLALLIIWETTLGQIFADSTVTWPARVVLASYPVCDIVILTLTIRLLLARRDLRQNRELGLLATGTFCWLVADFGYLAATGPVATKAWDVGWMTAVLIMGSASLGRRARRQTNAKVPPREVHDRMWLVTLPLLGPPLLELRGDLIGVEANPVTLLIASSFLIALVTWRGVRLMNAIAITQARLEASDHYFRTLALNSADAVLVIDASGTMVNDFYNVEVLLGTLRTPDALDSKVLVRDILRPVDVAESRSIFERSLLVPGQNIRGELRVMHSDGSVRWLSARLVNLLDDPDVRGVVVNLMRSPITSRRRASSPTRRSTTRSPVSPTACCSWSARSRHSSATADTAPGPRSCPRSRRVQVGERQPGTRRRR